MEGSTERDGLSCTTSKDSQEIIDLSDPQKVIEKYEEFRSKMPEIQMRYGNARENNLYDELCLWPSYFECSNNFSDNKKYQLEDRLNSFEKRLIEQHPNYKQTIRIYCALYKQLKYNPLKIRRYPDQILSILKEKQDN